MNKKHIFLLLILLPFATQAQRLMDRHGKVKFFSEAPLENIEADNSQALAALDLSNGNVAVTMLMKSFHFDKSLMEEHFNENYIESDKFPKATYKGVLKNFKKENLNSIQDSLKLSSQGELSLHGKTNKVSPDVVFYKNGNKLMAKTQFVIKIDDYDVKVPKMMIQNIAEEVLVTAIFSFETETN
ncbi:YceI family protein [Fulvivirga sediminis]|uniref:YceI family protein n=1 Tax=Fulvivirga sediminis TaxID=2803949 RepID=A0A937F6B6_9BACT|nr:YceI family protein [Fulvivirga sediminis]MBL3655831.1 YceI family protein [Fulvivirga sediminis]